jgi:uncharacterized protein (TIGR02391 family)
MERLPCFDASQLEAACRVLGDTEKGLTGAEIAHLLREIAVIDSDPALTKWKRIFNALAGAQNTHRVGNHLIMLINRTMAPARYADRPGLFHWRQDGLNVALAFAGYAVRDDGRVERTTRATTIRDARSRASRLRTLLEDRSTHQEVLKYCKAELLEENYFHAVFEAVKGVADRLRSMSGLVNDGAELVNQVLSTKAPLVMINSLRSETELSEQRGIANLLVGVFGAIRNPAAHEPKVNWPMPEQDAIDILGILSFVHRKLDNAWKA